MIYLLCGADAYGAFERRNELMHAFEANSIERYDAGSLGLDQLPSLLLGATLFSEKRCVVIAGMAQEKALWAEFEKYIETMPEETTCILYEPGTLPDKRTKTYKVLQKKGNIETFLPLSDSAVSEWLIARSKEHKVALSGDLARHIVERIGVDRWGLLRAVEILALCETITKQVIDDMIEPSPQARAFVLLDAVFAQNMLVVQKELIAMKQLEDPYRFFGLISQQLYQLSLLVYKDAQTAADIAKEIGVHPYPLQKLGSIARELTKKDVQHFANYLAWADERMKRTSEPWQVIEHLLIKLSAH